jgi:hypothetical protein
MLEFDVLFCKAARHLLVACHWLFDASELPTHRITYLLFVIGMNFSSRAFDTVEKWEEKGHERANIVQHSPDPVGCEVLGPRRLFVGRIQAIHGMNYLSTCTWVDLRVSTQHRRH